MWERKTTSKSYITAECNTSKKWAKYIFWSINWLTWNSFTTSLRTLKNNSKVHPQRHAWNQSPPKTLRETRLTRWRGTAADRRTALSADPAKRSALIWSPISATRIQPSTGSLPRAKPPARERHASSPLICYLLKVSASGGPSESGLSGAHYYTKPSKASAPTWH